MVFTERMVPEVIQPFWAALQRGEFITGAAESVGTYRVKGKRWLAATGGVRACRGRDLAWSLGPGPFRRLVQRGVKRRSVPGRL